MRLQKHNYTKEKLLFEEKIKGLAEVGAIDFLSIFFSL